MDFRYFSPPFGGNRSCEVAIIYDERGRQNQVVINQVDQLVIKGRNSLRDGPKLRMKLRWWPFLPNLVLAYFDHGSNQSKKKNA